MHTSDNVALCYFNPRSLTGATALLVCPQPHRQSFQSTLPYESNLNTQSNGGWISEISIHAPLRERLVDKIFLSEILAFQSTLPYGSDPRRGTNRSLAFTFQSTLPYGSDKVANCTPNAVKHFNPRSLAGATVFVLSRKLFSQISIHAPLRERRLGQESLNKRPFISIHAPLRERPGMVWFIQAKQGHFNPRSLAGATSASKWLIVAATNFNPRSLAGATHIITEV